MDTENTKWPADATPEVMETLRELARLSWHAASLASDTDSTHTVALALLDQLLILCQAQRGGVFMSRYLTTTTREQVAVLSPSRRKLLRPLALHEMNEEEAFALLATFSPEGVAIQQPPGELCWVIWRLTMPTSSLYRQDPSTKSSVGRAGSQTDVPFLAFLLLGWTGPHDTCTAAAEKAQLVLPLIADGAGAVLAQAHFRERVRELEADTRHLAVGQMELLKAEMLASVSHELRSPLASIKGYAATLLRHERRISREERHEFLVAIDEASDRLAGVIDRLLKLSQLETDTITIERTTVNLIHLIPDAITAMKQRLGEPEHLEDTADRQRQGRFSFKWHAEDYHAIPPDEQWLIQADRSRLREVLDQLLENAVNYSPEGGTIEVVIRPMMASQVKRLTTSSPSFSGNDDNRRKLHSSSSPQTQPMVEISISDTGMGIPEEHLERIFDRFHRVDTRLTREVNGLGLGLAICRCIVELHSGVIWAESEVGEGSSFHILLPMQAPA